MPMPSAASPARRQDRRRGCPTGRIGAPRRGRAEPVTTCPLTGPRHVGAAIRNAAVRRPPWRDRPCRTPTARRRRAMDQHAHHHDVAAVADDRPGHESGDGMGWPRPCSILAANPHRRPDLAEEMLGFLPWKPACGWFRRSAVRAKSIAAVNGWLRAIPPAVPAVRPSPARWTSAAKVIDQARRAALNCQGFSPRSWPRGGGRMLPAMEFRRVAMGFGRRRRRHGQCGPRNARHPGRAALPGRRGDRARLAPFIGVEVSYGDKTLKCKDLEHFDFSGVDLVLMSAGGSVSKEWSPKIGAHGAS